MRIRYIKPGFARNEHLADISIPARYLGALIPMLADKQGKLEDRPKRIRMELFPEDHDLDLDPLLDELQRIGYIQRYIADGLALIRITNFLKHQRPHANETCFNFPDPPDFSSNYAKLHETPQSSKGERGKGKEGRGKRKEETRNPVRHNPTISDGGTNAQAHQCFPQGLPETRPGQRMDFDRFIHQYPRPNGKQRAWEAWRELDPDIHAVLFALTWQRKSPSWASDVQHWPNPETYIRDQRWTDEPPMEVEANKPPDKIKDTFQNLMRKGVIPNGQASTDSRSSLSSGKRLPSKRDN